MTPGRHAPPCRLRPPTARRTARGPQRDRRTAWTQTPDPGAGPDRLVVGDLVIDLRGGEVLLAGRSVPLTRIEFDLVVYLAAHPGWVVSPDQLMEEVWGYRSVGDTRAVAVHIGNVRRKLENSSDEPRYIADGPRRRIQTGQP